MLTKKEADGEHPASHYLVVEDPDTVTTWHLRVRDVAGALDHRLMGAAWAALHGGYRGNVYEGPNKTEAIAKLRKLYEQEDMPMPMTKNRDILMLEGGVIKAMGQGKIGGYLVRFTHADQPDLTGEYFDSNTDFDMVNGDKASIYYNHGLDPVVKKRRLGVGAMQIQDTGVWVEAQLSLRDEYEKAIYAMAEAGALGWSSGTLPNLVEYEPAGKAMYIKSWPLGKDASLTPTPAAGLVLTAAHPLKAWAEATAQQQVKTDIEFVDIVEQTSDDGEAIAPEDTRPVSAPANEAAKRLELEILLMELEVGT